MPDPLSALERRVYHYLLDFLAENTYQPSIREIAREFRIKSTKSVSDILIALEKKGFIERKDARSRGVRLLGHSTGGQTQPVPSYERLSSSDPAINPSNRTGFITLDRRFVPADDAFLLRVRAEALPARGILEGDLILVSPSTRANDGELIVARSGASFSLRPASTNDGVGLGVVCGVFRHLRDDPTASAE